MRVNEIQQFQFNSIYNQVCRPINNLLLSKTPDEIWKKPLEYCNVIEKNPMEINTIVAIEAPKEQGLLFGNSSSYRTYRRTLCYTYMLLYYCHRDEEAYKQIVFPELVNNLGYFKDSQQKIAERIDKILKDEAILRDIEDQQENNKENKSRRQSRKRSDSQLTCRQCVILWYFVMMKNGINITLNASFWADMIHRMTGLNVQNLRTNIGQLLKDMDPMSEDIIIVANLIEKEAKPIAEMMRKQL